MNTELFLSGKNVVDINANYDYELANVRRQLSALIENQFNRELILKKYPQGERLLSAHDEGSIYIHDLSKILLQPYCYSFSVLPLVREGIKFSDSFCSLPARRLDTFIAHLREFSSHAAIRTRGAVGFADLCACLTYYVKREHLLETTEGQRFFKQKLQSFFYSLNENLREGSEAMFSNLNFFDRYYIESVYDDYFDILDIDAEDIMNVQKCILKWHTEEILTRKVLRFPIITVVFNLDQSNVVKDNDFLEFVASENMKHTMYNFLLQRGLDAIASCCRLISQTSSHFLNSYGSGGVSIGSHQVVSLNLPHIYLSSPKDFKERLLESLELVIDFLSWHRNLLWEHRHLDSLSESGYRSVNRMFSTLGLIGFWDLLQVADMSWEEGEKFIKDFVRVVDSYRQFMNIELVPAETAAYTLFDKDKAKFSHPHYSQVQMYSNQVDALWSASSFGERIKNSGRISKYFSGGSMTFISMQSFFTSFEQVSNLVKRIGRFGVPYFTFDTQINSCKSGHSTLGEVLKCPLCGAKINQKFRRIVGYFVNVNKFHERKERDLPFRKNISQEEAFLSA